MDAERERNGVDCSSREREKNDASKQSKQMTVCVGYNCTINEPQKWIYSTSLSVDRIHEIRHKAVKIYGETKPRERAGEKTTSRKIKNGRHKQKQKHNCICSYIPMSNINRIINNLLSIRHNHRSNVFTVFGVFFAFALCMIKYRQFR